MRKGFGIITAIIIMMTIATLMSLMMGLSSSTIKQTSDIYLKEQAQLLLKSGVEFALLAMSGHDNNSDCIESVDLTYNNFKVNIDIWYMGASIPLSCKKILVNNLKTKDSNYTAIVDIIVENSIATEPIRLHRRIIQKL
jgi:type II secretory pathway component PulK